MQFKNFCEQDLKTWVYLSNSSDPVNNLSSKNTPLQTT